MHHYNSVAGDVAEVEDYLKPKQFYIDDEAYGNQAAMENMYSSIHSSPTSTSSTSTRPTSWNTIWGS